MKLLSTILLAMMLCISVGGCGEGEALVDGFVAGAAAMETLAQTTQEDFISAVNELDAQTAEIRAAIEQGKKAVILKPETIEAFEKVKGREKDPVTWVALASILANMFWGGKTYGASGTKKPE